MPPAWIPDHRAAAGPPSSAPRPPAVSRAFSDEEPPIYLPDGERFTVQIRYRGVPVPFPDRIGGSEPGWMAVGGAVVVPPFSNAGWFPSNDHPRDKAPHMQLGDHLFFDIARAYTQRYHNSAASTRDFIELVQEISGQNLTDFFAEWLYADFMPSVPDLGQGG